MSEARSPAIDINAYVEALKRQRNEAVDREALLEARLADANTRLRRAENDLAAYRTAEAGESRRDGASEGLGAEQGDG